MSKIDHITSRVEIKTESFKVDKVAIGEWQGEKDNGKVGLMYEFPFAAEFLKT